MERRVVEAENGLDEIEKRKRVERAVETEGGEEVEEWREKRFGKGRREVEACEVRDDLQDLDRIDRGVLQNALEGEQNAVMDGLFARICDEEARCTIHCLMRWRSSTQNARSNEATLIRQVERSETARQEVCGVYDRFLRSAAHRIADTPAVGAASSSRSCGTQREALGTKPKRTKRVEKKSFGCGLRFYSFSYPLYHPIPDQCKHNTHRIDPVR